jgi:sulfoquinovose isomerase
MLKPQIQKVLDESGKTPYGEKFLTAQSLELIAFTKGSVIPQGGFGYLDTLGKVDSAKNRELYIQCRMIQVLGLGHLLGLTEARNLIDHGVDSILDLFQDKAHSGFYNSITSDGAPATKFKLAYDHMFVLLAACTAKTAGSPRADELLENIDSVIDKYFWDEKYKMMKDRWDLSFEKLENYRGINANMHAVEALCAAFDVTGNEKYRQRAYAICQNAVNVFAKNNDWMLPEHFNEKWLVDKNFNVDNPADPFCPYGVTIGHLFEWSRLILQLQLQIKGTSLDASWIIPSSKSLYKKAKDFGWAADGTEGFVYTIDWDGKPVVRSRMFWVAAEAVMTAYTLWVFTMDESYINDYSTWWKYIDMFVLDKANGSWFHELNPNQEVIDNTWPGKPDTYHAFNACILQMYPLSTSFIGTVLDFRRKLDTV